jgi:hypothetical protein
VSEADALYAIAEQASSAWRAKLADEMRSTVWPAIKAEMRERAQAGGFSYAYDAPTFCEETLLSLAMAEGFTVESARSDYYGLRRVIISWHKLGPADCKPTLPTAKVVTE